MTEKRRSAADWLAGWEGELENAFAGLPKSARQEVERILDQLPGGLKGWKDLLEHATRQVRLVSGGKRTLAIVGPANAGKSTLYNALIQPSEDKARVSAVPGTTRRVQQGEAGLFRIVDTPGTDAVGELGGDERQKAMDTAASADVLLVLFDAAHGVRASEKATHDALRALEVPSIVALNKMDLIGRERPEVLGRAAATLEIRSDQLVPISALKRRGLEQLLRAVVELEPEIVAALGAALPAYRWQLAQAVIGRSASAAAAIGLTPLPFLDFIPLIGLQTSTVLAIARIYNYRITLARAREMLAALGMGALGRTLFYELSKFGGPPSWLLAAGVAAGTTAALGYGSAIWFERGERLTGERLRLISRAFSEAIVDRLRSFGKRRPGRASMRERIHQALEDLSLPDAEPQALGDGAVGSREAEGTGPYQESGESA